MNNPCRNKKLTSAARGQECTLQIPGVCQGGTETTVACHSPLLEDRQGSKAPDFAIAFGCMACHDVIDRRKNFVCLDGHGLMCDEDQRYYFHRGMTRTLAILFDSGVIK